MATVSKKAATKPAATKKPVAKPTVKKIEQPQKPKPKSLTFKDFWNETAAPLLSSGHGVRGIINITLRDCGNNATFQEFVTSNPYDASAPLESWAESAFNFKPKAK